MIWSADTVKAVRGMGAKCVIATEALRYPDVIQEAQRKMWKAIDVMAHSYAVDLDRRDIVMQAREQTGYERDANLVPFTARWRPVSHEIIFTNGPGRGQRIHLPHNDLFRPYVVRVQMPDAEPVYEVEPMVMYRATLPVKQITYLFSGWDERGRFWTYTMEDEDDGG